MQVKQDRYLPLRLTDSGLARGTQRFLGNPSGRSPLENHVSEQTWGYGVRENQRLPVLAFSPSQRPPIESLVYVKRPKKEANQDSRVKLDLFYSGSTTGLFDDFYSNNLAVSPVQQIIAYSGIEGINVSRCPNDDYSPKNWCHVTSSYARSIELDNKTDFLYAACEQLIEHSDLRGDFFGSPTGLSGYDLERGTLLFTIQQTEEPHYVLKHDERFGVLAGLDHSIVAYDVRSSRISTHYSETNSQTCSIAIKDGNQFAAGLNSNSVAFFDSRKPSKPLKTVTMHQAAVKAMAFSPSDSNVIATGGGTADKCIRVWNVVTEQVLNVTPAEGQVSSLFWWDNKIIATNGYMNYGVRVWEPDTESDAIRLKAAHHMEDRVQSSGVITPPQQSSCRFFCLDASSTFSGFSLSVGKDDNPHKSVGRGTVLR